MKKLLGVLVFACLAAACAATVKKNESEVMLAFSTMYAVDGPFLSYKIRGLPGDEDAWIIGDTDGVVLENGAVSIKVRGLIFADGTPNDSPTFKARISCLSEKGETAVVETFVDTKPFPADAKGDSKIVDTVKLPEPCVAPIVLIMPGEAEQGEEPVWFAVTGAGD